MISATSGAASASLSSPTSSIASAGVWLQAKPPTELIATLGIPHQEKLEWSLWGQGSVQIVPEWRFISVSRLALKSSDAAINATVLAPSR